MLVLLLDEKIKFPQVSTLHTIMRLTAGVTTRQIASCRKHNTHTTSSSSVFDGKDEAVEKAFLLY